MKRTTGCLLAVTVLAMSFSTHAATDWSTQDYDLYAGDFDGDGKADLLYIAKDPAKPSGIARSNASGPNEPYQSWPSNYLGIPWHSNTYAVHIADFNGDGKADVLLQRNSPGDSYVLLTDANGRINGISQVIPNTHLGLEWHSGAHTLVVGDFNGDGRADAFLQATSPSGTHGVALANASGLFTGSLSQTWTDSSWGAFKWSTRHSVITAGDFNGDGRADLLIQARPNIVLIDYDIPIPVPTYQPNTFGLVRSVGGASPFQQSGVQQWSRNAHGVDWSPQHTTVIVGDFNGDGRADVLLQANQSSRPSYLLLGNASGAAFGNGTAVSANVAISRDSARLVAGNFNGSGGAGLYIQTTSPGGTNYLSQAVGSSISASAHNPSASTGVVPATAVGHTVGSFAVSAMGSATYSIPIVVPQGVNGMQPQLSINYDSGSGNGLLGMGWSLGGFSEIQRCKKTLAQDNSNDGVLLTTADRFCLDGNKLRLTGGTYGAANSKYQTEIETFSRVTAVGMTGNGPTSFKVEVKNGLTYEYGNSTNARIQAAAPATDTTTVHAWALNKVSDRHGNTMTITYTKENGSYRPNQILYTSNANASPSLAAAYRVTFYWEDRPAVDVQSGYFAGGLIRETKRLNRIETQYNDPDVGNWRLVRKYQLSYNDASTTRRSRLASVQECDRNSNCLSPTTIAWRDGQAGWSPAEAVSGSASAALMKFAHALDIDGDGITDLVYPQTSGSTAYWYFMRGTSAGSFTAPVNTGLNAGDTTNQQYAFALPIEYYGNGQWGLLTQAPGYSTRQILRWNGSTLAFVNTNLSTTLDGRQWVGDVDGDGRSDFTYATYSGSTATLYVQKSNGVASGTATFAAAQSYYSASSPASPVNALNYYGDAESKALDVNGDGRADLLFRSAVWTCGTYWCWNSTTFTVLIATSNAFVQAATWNCDDCGSTVWVGDLNGDGLTDIVYNTAWYTTGAPSTYQVLYGSGTGFATGPQLAIDGRIPAGVVAAHALVIADYNNDGRDDILYANTAGTWSVITSNGSGFDAAVDTGLPSSTAIDETVRIADFTGDGQLDAGYQNSAFRLRKHNGIVPDLLASITDGFGNDVTLTYAPLTDGTVYTKGTGAQYPKMELQAPLYVVKQYSASDGLGGSYSVTEKYAALRVDLRGRGLLGFASRESEDDRNGIRGVSTFLQDYPYIGFISDQSVYQPNSNTRIARTENTPSTLVLDSTANNGRRFPYVSQSVQTQYEVGGSASGQAISQVTTTTTLDGYGNPINVTSTTTDMTGSNASYVSATVNTFAPADAQNWCVGFLTQQQVTNTVPDTPSRTRTVEYVKDATNPQRCRVYQQIVEPSDDLVKVTTTYGYNAFGHPSTETVTAADIETRTTSMSYGDEGVFPRSITQSVTSTFSQTAFKTYDYALGVPRTAKDPNTLEVEWQYDGFGRLLREIRPDQTKTEWLYTACTVTNSYCGDSRLRYQVQKRELDNNNEVQRTAIQRFDAFGRSLFDQAQTLSGAYSVVATNYDNQGRVHQRSQPYFAGFSAYFTTITYDLIGRPTLESRRVSEADSGTQTTKYEYNRLIHKQEDANEKVTTKYFNAIGQVVQMTDAAGGHTYYGYDAFGNLTSTKDPANNEIVNTFNIRGFKLTSQDPNMGSWSYTYYPTGELRTQTDAKGQPVTFAYDRLSRPITRDEPEGTTTFTYGTSQSARNIGKLQSVASPGGYSEQYAYDTLGRSSQVTTNADGVSYLVNHTYHANTGLLETTRYPTSTSAVSGSRFQVRYEYASGLLKRVRDHHTPATIYWEQVATSAAGQAIHETYGNGVHTYSAYDAITGLLGERTAGSSAQVQNLTFQWDKLGNLMQRRDVSLNHTEDFTYDNVYRLKTTQLNSGALVTYNYAANGNITSKVVGSTTTSYNYNTAQSDCSYYGHTQPHAVRRVGSAVYCYDANGNMTSRAGSAITWYSNNLPNRIDQGSNYAQFFYGASRARYKQVAYTAAGGSLPAGTETTIYVRGLYERVTKPSGVIEHKHYILAGSEAVAIRTLRSGSGTTNDTRYLHKDHLGSVAAITNESGGVVERFSYDAFGKRRSATAWAGAPGSGEWTSMAAITHRGFTFHEHLDNVGLVHMNGRVYDPEIGRFISADPFVQAPLMSQSLNRYSYVMNNPLSLIDPSGYSWLSKAWRKLGRAIKGAGQVILSAVVVVYTAAVCYVSQMSACGQAMFQAAQWLAAIWSTGARGRNGDPNAPRGVPSGVAARTNGSSIRGTLLVPSRLAAQGGDDKKGQVIVGPLSNDDGRLDSLEKGNLRVAAEIFARLFAEGHLDDLGYGFVRRPPYDGITDPAFSVRFEPALGPEREDFGNRRALAVMDTDKYEGATAYRNSALTVDEALETIAHEIWHMEPDNRRKWREGSRAGMRGEDASAKYDAENEAVDRAGRVVERWYELRKKGWE